MATARRLDANLRRGRPVHLRVDGEPMEAYDGETVATALMAAGRRAFRETATGAEPRGVFCGIGLCFDCTVEVEGRGRVRACVTPVRDGMEVVTSPPRAATEGL